jgi:DNA-binding MarR family transcriptional regulator
MSRGDRTDERDDPSRRTDDRDVSRIREKRDPYSPADGLALPRGPHREDVRFHDRTYSLRGSETRALATVGAFRVVPADDLGTRTHGRDVWHGDLDRLAKQGLVEHTRISINHRPTSVVALTRDGKALLEAHREAREGRASQRYHAGLVKPRELGHDAQIYRLYQAEAAHIEREGGHVRRVVLDYELKREYQTFLQRRGHHDDASGAEAFGAEHQLPVSNGHLELPDLRIEYETEDGRIEQRDVELVTEHYSRGQLAGKAKSGFKLYGSGSRLRGGNSRHGGSPIDPHHLEWLR